jgi:hypothetical protein
VADFEGAGDIEVGAAVFEEVEGLEVLGAVGETFVVVWGCGEFLCGVVGFQACYDIISRGDAVVFFVELTDSFIGLGFREHAVEFVVEAGFAGVLGPGGEFLAGDTEFVADAFAVAALEVGLVFEVVDEAEVGFGIVEELGIVGVAGEAGVFGVEEGVEVGDGGDGGVVDGGVPEVDGGMIPGFGWWHGGLAPVVF